MKKSESNPQVKTRRILTRRSVNIKPKHTDQNKIKTGTDIS